MRARNWERLSEQYRRRLERKGVTRQEYLSGASLSVARGHARTPERPERAASKPEYAEYRRKRVKAPVIDRAAIKRHVRDLMYEGLTQGLIMRVDLWEFNRRIDIMSGYQLSELKDMSLAQLRERASEQTPQDWWVFIDNTWMNPFWYH